MSTTIGALLTYMRRAYSYIYYPRCIQDNTYLIRLINKASVIDLNCITDEFSALYGVDVLMDADKKLFDEVNNVPGEKPPDKEKEIEEEEVEQGLDDMM